MDYFFFNKLRFYKKSYDFNAVNLHSFILSRNKWAIGSWICGGQLRRCFVDTLENERPENLRNDPFCVPQTNAMR